MAYYDGEVNYNVDENSVVIDRDFTLQIPPEVLDDLYMGTTATWWVGKTGDEVRVEIVNTSGYSQISSNEFRKEPKLVHKRAEGTYNVGKETYIHRGASLRVGKDIINTLSINSPETNNVRWTVDTTNWRCVLTTVVK